MKQTLRSRGKERAEEACARLFVAWCSKQSGLKYRLERPERVFPESSGGQIWDFMARRDETDPEWKAIEIKELIIPKIYPKSKFWEDFSRDVTKDMRGKLRGTFQIVVPADLDIKVGQKGRHKFEKALIETFEKRAPRLKLNKLVDIGQDILMKFADSPHQESDPLAEPLQLHIMKTSDNGCEIKSSAAVMGPVPGAIEQALNGVFGGRKEPRANEQLGLAKHKGAKETILLLDCNPLLHDKEQMVRDCLARLDADALSNIDHIYLVGKLCSKDSYQALFNGRPIKEEIKLIEVYSKERRGKLNEKCSS